MLGQVEKASRNFEEAKRSYAAAVQQYEELQRKRHIADPFHVRQLNVARSGIDDCIRSERSLVDLDFVMALPPAYVPLMLELRSEVFSAKMDRKNLAETAEAFAKLVPEFPAVAFDAARSFSLLAGLADGANTKYTSSTRAIELLRRTPTGPKHRFRTTADLADWLVNDRNFDPLRTREDFRALIAEFKAAKSMPKN